MYIFYLNSEISQAYSKIGTIVRSNNFSWQSIKRWSQQIIGLLNIVESQQLLMVNIGDMRTLQRQG